jgi:hypothetical protein
LRAKLTQILDLLMNRGATATIGAPKASAGDASAS